MAAAMKHMTSNLAKLDKFEGVDFRRWQKKMHFLLSSMLMVYVLTTSIPEDELWDSLEAKYMAEDASSKKFLVSCIIDKLPLSWKDFKHTLKHLKDELTLVKLGSYLHIEESLRVQDNDKPKGNNIAGPLVVNMVKHNISSRYNDNKGKRKHHDYTRANPNKKAKLTCWKCGKIGHIKRDYKGINVGNKAIGLGIKDSVDGSSNSLKAYFVQDDDVAWWVNSRATVYVCIDRCWFKTCESLKDGSILHMGNESTALVHRRGCVDLRLGHVHFKRMQDMFKDGLIPAFDIDIEKYTKDEALDKFKVFKTEVELQQGSLIRQFRTDRGAGESLDGDDDTGLEGERRSVKSGRYVSEGTIQTRSRGVRHLEDQVVLMRFLALGWHLEEIHLTWAHLEKKQTRLWTCTKIHQEVLFLERGDGVASIKQRRRDLSGDGVWILATASQRLLHEKFYNSLGSAPNHCSVV
ncbi:zinc finger, CCHC-type containing protein [Tanacetum coccineum]